MAISIPEINSIVIANLKKMVGQDKKNILYFFYYSLLEAFLLLIAPLTSAFIINSVMAHASISIITLSLIVIIVFGMIVVVQIIKIYMIEKFEQKIFVQSSIEVALLAIKTKANRVEIDKYMNYFFDVVSIQKILPSIFITAASLIMKIIISLILLLFFNISFFILGIIFIILFSIIVLLLGKNGTKYAIARSNAKHEAIYYLQNIPEYNDHSTNLTDNLNKLLINFVEARERIFAVIAKQLSIAFIVEGLILSSFFIMGGYLVFEGLIPIGEFVAAEIIIISITYALRDFMKQIDYIYDAIEGFYKIDKLNTTLEKKSS